MEAVLSAYEIKMTFPKFGLTSVKLCCDGLKVDSVTSKRKQSPGLDGNETDEESRESEKTVSKKKQSCAQDERNR